MYNLKTDVYKELRLREMQNFVCMDRRKYGFFATCTPVFLVVWEIRVKSWNSIALYGDFCVFLNLL